MGSLPLVSPGKPVRKGNNFLFFFKGCYQVLPGFPSSSVGKESACNAGDLGSIPGLGRSPGEGIVPTPVFQIIWSG